MSTFNGFVAGPVSLTRLALVIFILSATPALARTYVGRVTLRATAVRKIVKGAQNCGFVDGQGTRRRGLRVSRDPTANDGQGAALISLIVDLRRRQSVSPSFGQRGPVRFNGLVGLNGANGRVEIIHVEGQTTTQGGTFTPS